MPMQQSGPSAPLPLAGRRPTPPVGMPVAVPNAPMPAQHHPGQPTIPPHGNRSATLLGMPDAPPPPVLGNGQPALGESPPTQAVDVFGGPPPGQGMPQFQFDASSGSMPVHNNALTMPPPSGYAAEEPPKRSSMKFVLLAACAASALILSVAGYVAVSGNRRTQSASSQAAIRAPHPAVAARAAAQPTPVQPAAAPVAQPLAPAPVAQALAPTTPPAEAPQAQVLAAPAGAPQPPAATSEPAQAANEPDDREARRGRRVRPPPPAEAPAARPVPRAVAAARAPRPAAQPAAAARPARPARVRRGPITEVPF